jgi:hypothetical protein
MLPASHPIWTIDAHARLNLSMHHAGIWPPEKYPDAWHTVAVQIEEFVALRGETQIEDWHVMEFFARHWNPRPNDTVEKGLP